MFASTGINEPIVLIKQDSGYHVGETDKVQVGDLYHFAVEKGTFSEPVIEFKCSRTMSRHSAMEYISISGHDLIPHPGTRVRAYLDDSGTTWTAAVPNGGTPPEADTDDLVWPEGSFPEAAEASEWRSLLYTLVLAFERWAFLFFVLLPLAVVVFYVIRRF